MLKRLENYASLMRMDKPIGTLLLAWPTLWALWLAGMYIDASGEWVFGGIQPDIILIFLAGAFLMRSAGCVINDFADKDIDKHVKRTAARPLALGQISTKEALMLFMVLALLAFMLLFLIHSDERLEVMAWSLPAVLTVIAYPFMKRFFVTPQLVLGVAFSFAIPMTYAAYGHNWNAWLPVFLLVLANVAWVVAYDTQYAMVDRNDDINIGVKSSAVYFGAFDKLAIAALQLSCIVFLLLVGKLYELNQFYFWIVLASAGFFVYQQHLIKGRDREYCFKAFLNNSWFGGTIWLAIVLGTAVI